MGQLVEYVRASQSAKSFRVHRRFVGEIIEIVRPSLFVFIAARCAPDRAEDVLQDTLVVIATKLAGFQCEADAQVWAWCYKIAANKLKQCHQQTQRHPTESLDVEEIRRLVEAVAAEESLPDGVRLDLEDALKLLEFGVPPCRDLLWFHYVLGLDYQEIANLYLMAYDTARMKIHRCLERAQELLGKGENQSHV